jgi:hypothetical protein
MHQATKLQLERIAREYSDWMAVPDAERSAAPAWWWQPVIDVVAQQEEMAAILCYRMRLPLARPMSQGLAQSWPLSPIKRPRPGRMNSLASANQHNWLRADAV